MADTQLPENVAGLHIHLVGAKGTGLAALAEILAASGARLSGSDVADVFYTDAILARLGVELKTGFEAGHVERDTALVIHSAAYRRDQNPELLEAERLCIPILSYPEALGALSRRFDSSGIAGVHGKTTTTAMAGSLVSGLGLPATVLAGSAVASFGGSSTLILGGKYFIAETCEYRRHFLSFRPRRIVLTSVESDHQDYYPSYDDILEAFVEYAMLLPEGGKLIYCADDPGACETADRVCGLRPDIVFLPYGRKAEGDFRIESYHAENGRAVFRLAGLRQDFELHVPGEHLALDATAALALALDLLEDSRPGRSLSPAELGAIVKALASFSGSKRRSELLGEAGGVLFMDDYGHHPTAIRDTIRGVKEFWPARRIVVDFMSHTYSRTRALFGDFASCLDEADVVIMHKIYPSARENPEAGLSGRDLFEAARSSRSARGRGGEGENFYFDEPLEAEVPARGIIRPGDLFLTMGAGDNWKLGAALLENLRNGEKA